MVFCCCQSMYLDPSMCYGLVLSCVILQAIPYIRCIGESWPMTKERAYFETLALREHGRLSPEHLPEVYHFDRTMSLFGMRYLEPPHIILRKGLIAGTEYPLLAEHISEYMARTLYFTSLLYNSTTEHKRAGTWWSISVALDISHTSFLLNFIFCHSSVVLRMRNLCLCWICNVLFLFIFYFRSLKLTIWLYISRLCIICE